MKFRFPRPQLNEKIRVFGSERIRRQKIPVPRASRKVLEELASISREIEKQGLPSHLVLKKLKGKLGRGIFLHPEAKPLLKGDLIASYSGEVSVFPQNDGNDSDYVFALITDLILSREEQRFFDPSAKYHPRRLYSLDLDAEKRGNFTRFINHSAQPNVEAHFLRIPANDLGLTPAPFEILYIAKKTIRPGEQILVCYEGEDRSYWGAIRVKPFPMTPRTFRLNSSLQLLG